MTRQELAWERLKSDTRVAVQTVVASLIRYHTDDAKVIARLESEIADGILKQLDRNWKMVERSRAERSAT